MSHELYVSHHTLYDVCKIWGLCLWNMWVLTYMSHGLHESRTMWDINYMSHELYSSQIVWRLQDLGSVLWHIRVPTYMSHRLYGHELYESRTIWDVAYMSHELYVSQIIWVLNCLHPCPKSCRRQAIDWFWLLGWIIHKGAICTRIAPLWISTSNGNAWSLIWQSQVKSYGRHEQFK